MQLQSENTESQQWWIKSYKCGPQMLPFCVVSYQSVCFVRRNKSWQWRGARCSCNRWFNWLRESQSNVWVLACVAVLILETWTRLIDRQSIMSLILRIARSIACFYSFRTRFICKQHKARTAPSARLGADKIHLSWVIYFKCLIDGRISLLLKRTVL